MHIVMLGVPQPVSEELERTLHEEGTRHAVDREVRHARALEELPETLPPGLVVLWDAGGPLDALLVLCQRLHSRREPSRSQFVVLTGREGNALDALAHAGADECLAPPGERWGTRLIALERRLRTMEPSALVADPRRSVHMESTLQSLLHLTLAEPGPEFFQSLVKPLAQALGVTCALVGELDGNDVRKLACFNPGDFSLEARQMDYALINAFAVRASAELERSRDLLQKTLDAVPDPLVVKDRGHRWLAMNSAFSSLLGRPQEELLGRTDHDFLPASEADTFWQQDEQVFTTGQPHEYESDFTNATGQPRTIVSKKALFNGLGGRPLLMVLVRDVTERKRLESQLRLADRMASVGTLATGVAHEINNPLTFVSANLTYLEEQFSQMLVMPEALPELREVLTETKEGVGRIRELVQDLKSFARADEDTRGPVDVHRVVDGALRLMRSALHHRTQVVRSLGEVPLVRGNEARLGQVIVNLLVNALQALPARHPDDNRIQVSAWREGLQHVVLEVEDNGQGMPEEIQRRIFEPFFTTKPVGVGTGLGLAICQTIVQSMGGQIEVRSEPGQGTAFRLRLPVEDAAHSRHRGHEASLPQ